VRLWEGKMLEYQRINLYRVIALRRRICLLVQVARSEVNTDHRQHLLEMAVFLSRTADAIEHED
jgi:hypothetical protein